MLRGPPSRAQLHGVGRARCVGVQLQRRPVRGQPRQFHSERTGRRQHQASRHADRLQRSGCSGLRLQWRPVRGQLWFRQRQHRERACAGKLHAELTLSGLASPDALAFVSSGNLYVANGSGGTVSEFSAASTGPTVTTTSTALAYVEQSGARAIDSGVTIADSESSTLASATVTISSGYNSGMTPWALRPRTASPEPSIQPQAPNSYRLGQSGRLSDGSAIGHVQKHDRVEQHAQRVVRDRRQNHRQRSGQQDD